jgi:hypothetical protein
MVLTYRKGSCSKYHKVERISVEHNQRKIVSEQFLIPMHEVSTLTPPAMTRIDVEIAKRRGTTITTEATR